MPSPTATYTTRVSGLWNSRHEIHGEEGLLGVLTVTRNWHGMVTQGEYHPESGEELLFRRDPGLLRSQFSVWTDGREWLGASLRQSNVRRAVAISTGGKPYMLLPRLGLSRGWILQAPKTGLTASIEAPLVGRSCRLEVYRRLDFALLMFAYFLGVQLLPESIWPGPELHEFPG